MSEAGQWIRPNEKSAWTRTHDLTLWGYEIVKGYGEYAHAPHYDKDLKAVLRLAQIWMEDLGEEGGLSIYVGADSFTAHYMGESEDFDLEAKTCSEAVAWVVWFGLQEPSYRAAQYEEKVARI